MARETANGRKPQMLPVLALGLSFSKRVAQVVVEADERIAARQFRGYRPIPTGFNLLDAVLAGGLRPGELILLGGRHGVGKTIFALQVTRNIALPGEAKSPYVCFSTTRSISSTTG